jgi:thymidylate synthase (FAD)
MPKNLDLNPVTFPMNLRFDEEPTTEFKNDLESINVVLLDYPDPLRARRMVYQFINATWEDEPGAHDPDDVEDWKLFQALEAALQFKALPTVLETLDFTFRIEGIDLQTVTHLIRHRTGSFSAQCTGDRWQTHANALVPGPVQNSPELYERWKKLVNDSKELYCDMINTNKISIMDARTVLPKCLETHYYARFNLKDLLNFVRQRMDKQIQPTTDNVIAYQLYLSVARIFPEVTTVINMHSPSRHYVATARTGKATNLYFPDDDSDTFEWHPNDFIYQGYRDEINGTDEDLGCRENFKFSKLQEMYDNQLSELVEKYNDWKASVEFRSP